MKSHPLIVSVVVIILLGAGLAFVAGRPTTDVPVVTSFAECATFYPVMESSPRQCRTPDGRSFTEELPQVEEETPTVSEEGSNVAGIADLIEVTSPTINGTVSSPLVVTGSARGTWYFEASFPIEVRNASGALIGQGYGQAQGEWMTENFVPFKSVPITFTAQPKGSTGTVVLKKDNPSGLPENDRSLEIPITF